MVYGISLGLSTTLNTAVVADFFEGDERVSVMGIQAASIGAGMVLITTAAGWLGMSAFKNSYWINIIGFLSLILIAVCLPDAPEAKAKEKEKIRLNGEVFTASLFAFLEFLFLIAFTTNISMHIGGALKGNTAVSGVLTGVFLGYRLPQVLCLGESQRLQRSIPCLLPCSVLLWAQCF
ncbi:MAG: MFS transporter [Blautia marasmi]